MNIEDIGERPIKTPARAIMVSGGDNVAVVLNEVRAGDKVILTTDWHEIAAQNIPTGHKMAISFVAIGLPVIKSGEVVGLASRPIQPGDHVHTHNLQVA